MHHTIPNKRIATKKYRRSDRKSIDHTLNHWLLFDMLCYHKSSFAMTLCDSESCYDRVTHTTLLQTKDCLIKTIKCSAFLTPELSYQFFEMLFFLKQIHT